MGREHWRNPGLSSRILGLEQNQLIPTTIFAALQPTQSH